MAQAHQFCSVGTIVGLVSGKSIFAFLQRGSSCRACKWQENRHDNNIKGVLSFTVDRSLDYSLDSSNASLETIVAGRCHDFAHGHRFQALREHVP